MPDRINVPTRTLYIGDNLDFLRGINSNSVSFIYLDPPRNSGRTYEAPANSDAAGFTFDDTWTADDMRPDWRVEIREYRLVMLAVTTAARRFHGEGLEAYLTFMGVRLTELHRILKPSGSIYLHCDPSVSHYLKLMMDALFGPEQFKSEIIWKRMVPSAGPKRWRWAHDTLLFYAGPRKYVWNQVLQEPSPEYLRREYHLSDEGGRFQAQPLLRSGTRDDDRSAVWRGIDPSETGQHWVVTTNGLKQTLPERDDLDDLSVVEKLDLLEQAGLVHWPRTGGLPRFKVYADMKQGERLSDLVTSVGPVDRRSREYTGWPEQAPEALLDIIIRASSREGDIVLDPFCGSGTACVVAEKLGRRWIGIERAEQSQAVLQRRFEDRRYPGFTAMVNVNRAGL